MATATWAMGFLTREWRLSSKAYSLPVVLRPEAEVHLEVRETS